jgi:hypothetical protein
MDFAGPALEQPDIGFEQGLIALPGPAKIDQIQGTADLVQPFLTNMEVSGRGGETAMAQQSLEAERVDASFQQMRGKTVTQMPSSAFASKCGAPGNAEWSCIIPPFPT